MYRNQIYIHINQMQGEKQDMLLHVIKKKKFLSRISFVNFIIILCFV